MLIPQIYMNSDKKKSYRITVPWQETHQKKYWAWTKIINQIKSVQKILLFYLKILDLD